MGGPQDSEDSLQTVRVDHIANADEVQVARRNTNDEIGLTDNPQNEIEPVLPFDLAGFDVFDHGGPMIGVNHRFTDCKRHIVLYPFRTPKFSTLSGSLIRRLR